MLGHKRKVDHLEQGPHRTISSIPSRQTNSEQSDTETGFALQRKGGRTAYVGTNLCFTSSLHSSMVEPLSMPTP